MRKRDGKLSLPSCHCKGHNKVIAFYIKVSPSEGIPIV